MVRCGTLGATEHRLGTVRSGASVGVPVSDWESHLARAKWMTERGTFHHITAYDVSEIRFARNGNLGVSVGVIFVRILGAGMLLPRR